MTSDGRLFKYVKNEFSYKTYLNLNNRSLRVSITKIRLSSNLFLVERGRWGTNRMERKDRVCSLCGCIEDEFHCLLECPRFNNERQGLVPSYIHNNRNMHNFVKFLATKNVCEQRQLGILCLKIQKQYRDNI